MVVNRILLRLPAALEIGTLAGQRGRSLLRSTCDNLATCCIWASLRNVVAAGGTTLARSTRSQVAGLVRSISVSFIEQLAEHSQAQRRIHQNPPNDSLALHDARLPRHLHTCSMAGRFSGLLAYSLLHLCIVARRPVLSPPNLSCS